MLLLGRRGQCFCDDLGNLHYINFSTIKSCKGSSKFHNTSDPVCNFLNWIWSSIWIENAKADKMQLADFNWIFKFKFKYIITFSTEDHDDDNDGVADANDEDDDGDGVPDDEDEDRDTDGDGTPDLGIVY